MFQTRPVVSVTDATWEGVPSPFDPGESYPFPGGWGTKSSEGGTCFKSGNTFSTDSFHVTQVDSSVPTLITFKRVVPSAGNVFEAKVGRTTGRDGTTITRGITYEMLYGKQKHLWLRKADWRQELRSSILVFLLPLPPVGTWVPNHPSPLPLPWPNGLNPVCQPLIDYQVQKKNLM